MTTTTSSKRPPKPPSAFIEGPAADAVPIELRRACCWIVWAWVWNEKKNEWDKPPIDPQTGKPIDQTDSTHWMTFGQAQKVAHKRGDGIGIALGSKEQKLGIVGADLDKCIDDQGNVSSEAMQSVKALDSYTERTPSGRGLRVLVRGTKPGAKCKNTKRGIELYEADRYFTVTGNHLEGTPTTIEPRQEALEALYAELFEGKPQLQPQLQRGPMASSKPQSSPFTTKTPDNRQPSELSDDELIERIRRSKQGDLFAELSDRGDVSRYADDESSADLALLNVLAFWTARDASRMESLFSRSALGQRPKWCDRPDYRERTIGAAIADTREVYSPRFSANGDRHQIDVNEAADDPHRLARLHSVKYQHRGESTLRHYRGESFLWTNGAYRPIVESELKAGLNGTIKGEFDRLNRTAIKLWDEAGGNDKSGKAVNKPEVRQVTIPLVANVAQALQSTTILPGKDEAPFWIGNEVPFDPAEVMPIRNALVHLPSVVVGETVDQSKFVLPPTPRFFSTYSLDFDFDLDTDPPVELLKFLRSVWPKDVESINALQEWFGYCLTPDTRQQKIGTFIGPKRSGRGTIARLLRRLVGPENTAGPRLSAFAANFGLEPLIGKPLAIIGDARLSGRSDKGAIVEALLSISGEDTLTIDRKHKPSWTGKLPTRLMLLSNELPKLPDESGALVSRQLLWRFKESFLGREDLELDARLSAELPSILLWSIEGWKRLHKRGHFLQPKSGQELLDQMLDISSPVGTFVRECCAIDPRNSIEVGVLFAAWCSWCDSKKRHPGEEASFGRNLRTVIPLLETKVKRGKGDKAYVRFFEGVELGVEEAADGSKPAF